MRRVITTLFFHVRQNNSGGYFIVNDDVAITVEPTIYGEKLEGRNESIVIHYYDGRKERIGYQ